jgi:hypothetical protein
MTPILLLLAFLLMLDVLVLLGHSHDSRDGQDWQPRGLPSPDLSAVAPISRPDRCRLAMESESVKRVRRLWSLAVRRAT